MTTAVVISFFLGMVAGGAVVFVGTYLGLIRPKRF